VLHARSDPAGKLVPKKVARLETAIHGYEAQLAAGCKRFSQCRYDGERSAASSTSRST
jgi:hypothetical protein